MFGAPRKTSTKNKDHKEKTIPFVSATRRRSTFGTPAPLPGMIKSASKSVQQQQDHIEAPPPPVLSVQDTPPPPPPEEEVSTRMVHSMKFLKQSVRWLNLSTSLWSMIVVDASRVVNSSSLMSFLLSMMWRIHNEVSEEEFTEVFREWMGRSHIEIPHKYNCSVFLLRDLLLEQENEEKDLDLMLGMIINETNRMLLNVPLNFDKNSLNNDEYKINKMLSKPTLELCTRRWLTLCEELFFLLDSAGFGYLSFDQMFIFSACLLLAKSEWFSEAEAENILNIKSISAMAYQMMKDSGANVSLDAPAKDEQKRKNLERRKNAMMLKRRNSVNSTPNFSLSRSPSRIGSVYRPNFSMDDSRVEEQKAEEQSVRDLQRKLYNGQSSNVVSLVMFKRLLVSRGLGESSLLLLVTHVKRCASLLYTVGRNQSSVLYQSCTTYGDDETGSAPCLFHRCVYSVAGWSLPASRHITTYQQQQSAADDNASESVMSPVLLFLLSDVEGLIPGAWIASLDLELCLVQQHNVDDNSSEVSEEGMTADEYLEKQKEIRSFCDKITFDVTKKLWLRFSNWGDSAFEPGSKNFYEIREAVPADDQIQREPTFRFISSVLAEYKATLLLMTAALVDIAMDHFTTLTEDEDASVGAVAVAAKTVQPRDSDLASILEEMSSSLPSVSTENNDKSSIIDDIVTSQGPNFVGISLPAQTEIQQSPSKTYTTHVGDGKLRKSPLNLLFSPTSVFTDDTTKNLEEENDRSPLNTSTREQEEHRSEAVNMAGTSLTEQSLPPARSPQADSSDIVRMEEVEDNSFAKWVNTDTDCDDGTIKEMSNMDSEQSSKLQSLINDAVWSSVLEETDECDHKNSQAPEKIGKILNDEQAAGELMQGAEKENSPTPNRNRHQQEYESETPSQSARREFFRRAEVSDDGSPPGGLKSDDLSHSSRFNNPNLDISECRRSRRKHRQLAKAKYNIAPTEFQPSTQQEQQGITVSECDNNAEKTFSPSHHLKLDNEFTTRCSDENEDGNATGNVMLGVEESCESDMHQSFDNKGVETSESESAKNEFDNDKGEHDMASVASSSSMANSVIELLEKGQTAGLYAQSLRDLLRKMSLGDHNMNLKSLEKIIELGNSIVEQEHEADHHPHRTQRRKWGDGRVKPKNTDNATTSKFVTPQLGSPNIEGKDKSALRDEQFTSGQNKRQMTTQVHRIQSVASSKSEEKNEVTGSVRRKARDGKPAIESTLNSSKKRIPGVVPVPRSRNRKQAFSS